MRNLLRHERARPSDAHARQQAAERRRLREPPEGTTTEDKAPAVETFQDRVNKQMRKELQEADSDWVRAQKLTDYLWQQKLDAEASFYDDHVEIGGFRELRTRYGFTKTGAIPTSTYTD